LKKILVLTVLLLAVTASLAMAAAGVNLTWGNKCYADGATVDQVWDCNSNTGGVAGTLSLSFQTAASHPDFVAIGFYLEGMTEEAVVPDWWKMSTGECRVNGTTMNTNFTALTTACTDLWAGLGGGGIGLYSDDTNRMHLNAAWAMADSITIDPNIEYLAAQFNFSRAKTVGTGACAGCDTKAIWSIYRLEIGFLSHPTEMLTFPLANQCVTWQTSTLSCTLVPTRNTTWGQVKSLYR
jgi:hypothetical protein